MLHTSARSSRAGSGTSLSPTAPLSPLAGAAFPAPRVELSPETIQTIAHAVSKGAEQGAAKGTAKEEKPVSYLPLLCLAAACGAVPFVVSACISLFCWLCP